MGSLSGQTEEKNVLWVVCVTNKIKCGNQGHHGCCKNVTPIETFTDASNISAGNNLFHIKNERNLFACQNTLPSDNMFITYNASFKINARAKRAGVLNAFQRNKSILIIICKQETNRNRTLFITLA